MEWDTDTTVRPGETAVAWAVRTGHFVIMRICMCCMVIEANGDVCGDEECDTCRNGGLYAQAYAKSPNMTVTLGAFTDECGHDLSDDTQSEQHTEGCERFGFTQSSCDLCGSRLHGDRDAAVAWPRVIPAPFIEATKDNQWKSNLLTFVGATETETNA